MDHRIVFMGSPEFSIPALESLAAGYNVVGVVTQPDRPAGRGRTLSSPPVKTLAEKIGLPVIQPERLRQPEVIEQLKRWKPDLIVVVAFGQILRPDILDLTSFGCLNVHASLLPRWRGAAPIPAAILHGDLETGVTIMRMEAGLDTGPIISQKATSILQDDTAGTLASRLSTIGSELLLETLPGYFQDAYPLIQQEEKLATYAPMLKKKDGELDFYQPAVQLARCVRAFNPWPGAFTTWEGQILKIHRASPMRLSRSNLELVPGTRVIINRTPAIVTSEDALGMDEVQPAGKNAIPGKVFLQGRPNWGQLAIHDL